MIRIEFPRRWSECTEGTATFQAEAGDVGQLLDAIGAAFPGLSKHLPSSSREAAMSARLVLNDSEVLGGGDRTVELNDGDVVTFLFPVAGG